MDSNTSIIVAVMGVTGAGKSTLIQRITQNRNIVIGHGLKSETQKTTAYQFRHGRRVYTLVDCPGFNDTIRSDQDVLEDITSWLSQNYGSGQLLSGIIYLHPISDTRVQGSTMTQFRVFKELCGDAFYSNIVLGTTFWSKVCAAEGEARERQLFSTRGMLGDMRDLGAEVVRVSEDRSECLRLIERFTGKTRTGMRVQKELAKSGSAANFMSTSAGKLLSSINSSARNGWRAKVDSIQLKHSARREKRALIRENRATMAQVEKENKNKLKAAEKQRQADLRAQKQREKEERDRLEKAKQEQKRLEQQRLREAEAEAARQRADLESKRAAAEATARRLEQQQAIARAELARERQLAREEEEQRKTQERVEEKRRDRENKLREFDIKNSKDWLTCYNGTFFMFRNCGQPGCSMPLQYRDYYWCSVCEVYACSSCYNAGVRIQHGGTCPRRSREGYFGGQTRENALSALGMTDEDVTVNVKRAAADVFKAALREHELIKYLQLFPETRSGRKSLSFSYILPDLSTLRDALDAQIELLAYRLGVKGAFALLYDDHNPYFLAGTPAPVSGENGASSRTDGAKWLATGVTDMRQWLHLFQDTIKTKESDDLTTVLTIPSLKEDKRAAEISSVLDGPKWSFFAGTPMCSKPKTPIGLVFVVDDTKSSLSAVERDLLVATAARCVDQLMTARETGHQMRWRKINKQLSKFVRSPAVRAQELEEPPDLASTSQQERRTSKVEEVKELALRGKQDPSEVENVELPEETYHRGPENDRLIDEEKGRDEHIVAQDNEKMIRAPNGTDEEPKRGGDQGETSYRKLFRRAAEYLQDALNVDGVLFSDGLVGHHGAINANPELEEDLEHEIRIRPKAEVSTEDLAVTESSKPPKHDTWADNSSEEKATPSETSLEHHSNTNFDSLATRTFTSPEYIRGICVQRPAQILGMATRDPKMVPENSRLTNVSIGLSQIDEVQLQKLMDQYPEGIVWYMHHESGKCYKVINDTLTAEGMSDTKRLISSFPGVRQVIFQPLTDPVSLKRLAGCFAWTKRSFPVFTDTTDVPSLRGFLHVLESEIARMDASTAVKQKEAFVSSVSHELRTPLHGILGSVQLLADTRLNTFQASLAETIKTSGSTLNETLTSVLSYAKINQFERQQHKYRERAAPDVDRSNWSLQNKPFTHAGPDTDYKELYLCTNIAMLFEEIAGVLEGGRAYDKTMSPHGVTVTLEMDYHDNWNYLTEPGALRRTAVNIIGNALKYTSDGSVVIRLTSSKMDDLEPGPDIPISEDNADRRLVSFSVRDTGKGMSKDFMDNHLFVPFTQEDTTSSHGVGLGMSIVKSLVSLLAGEIKVTSEQGKGTEVTITMPMRLCDEGDDDKPASELTKCIQRVRSEGLSCVLFGFRPEVRKSLERYLKEWFHCKMLEPKEDTEPDLVIMDEGNEEIWDEVVKTSQRYGRTAILVSIAMRTDRLAKPMRPVRGYRFCKRIPPPIGPNNLGKSLSACVDRLQDLRKEGWEGKDDPILETHQPFRGPAGEDTGKNSAYDDRGRNEEAAQTYETGHDGSASGFRGPKERNRESSERRTRNSSSSSSQERPLSAAGSEASIASVDPSDLNVLVAEDNAINRKILGAFLGKSGCKNVQYAENGQRAVEAVEKKRPGRFDIIFMDLSMPVMDGFTATREIRQLERQGERSSAPKLAYIVALTGLASDRDEDAARRAGVDMFVTKPVQFDKLTDVLKQQEKRILRKD
ncbi:hypothetical protein M011DRAFT_478035 [Sporormia fimetaria CBS 119925]|uniref:Uncharacterized protein n=1 Tax=Sporormia fimetaria CBS 119925 TaxID=1340428 RepID=A0A6A6V9L3_9PLEO|nr:hypothetical protein M011DRAFT_478035 [Sporormia fimetaria CBS 119925]